MVCNRCGMENQNESSFCISCGEKLVQDINANQHSGQMKERKWPYILASAFNFALALGILTYFVLIPVFFTATEEIDLPIAVSNEYDIEAGLEYVADSADMGEIDGTLDATVMYERYEYNLGHIEVMGAIAGIEIADVCPENTSIAAARSSFEALCEVGQSLVENIGDLLFLEAILADMIDAEAFVWDFEIEEIYNIILGWDNATNVSAAILNLETGEIFSTANGDIPFVASGFYAPIHNIAFDRSITLHDSAAHMMATMDNVTANALIETLGGFSTVNAELHRQGFINTSFSRNFGDIAASNRGIENYTTAKEAVEILAMAYVENRHPYMNVDLAGDGIRIPDGTHFYAHTGQGIGDAYNVFAIVTTQERNYTVAVLTSGMGIREAAPLITEILANMQEQMAD